MDTAQTILVSLLFFLFTLVVLNIAYYGYKATILIFSMISLIVKLRFKQLKKLILSLFGVKSETPSDSMTIDLSDFETPSDSLQEKEPVQLTSTLLNCDHQKPLKGTLSKNPKRDSKGRFCKS